MTITNPDHIEYDPHKPKTPEYAEGEPQPVVTESPAAVARRIAANQRAQERAWAPLRKLQGTREPEPCD